jgi:hypothetical protein
MKHQNITGNNPFPLLKINENRSLKATLSIYKENQMEYISNAGNKTTISVNVGGCSNSR